jgi:hypothetical protein
MAKIIDETINVRLVPMKLMFMGRRWERFTEFGTETI